MDIEGLQFENNSKMWKDLKYPPLVDFWSTQFLSIYLLAICMIVSCVTAAFMVSPEGKKTLICIVVGVVISIVLVILAYYLLKDSAEGGRDNKNTNE